MATELRTFQITTPAGTPQATPLTSSLAIPVRTVRNIKVQVPPGPRGELGWFIASGGFRVWPINAGTWIATDNEVVNIPTDDTLTSGAWQLVSYNTGLYPHTVTVRFFLDPVAAPTPPPAVPLPSHALSGSVNVGSTGNPVGDTVPPIAPFVPPDAIPTAAANFAVPAGPGLPP